ncbi:MAG TPA: serine/threonine-protein kinase [Polyangiaceae bacterium]|nr:serine/threonine-protein kinase [Polyangiaceae bacterium]
MSDAADDIIQRAQLRVGQALRGKWKLEKLLGVGGMASVYAAVHRNGMRGAVKMLHAELSTHAGARERFTREGYAANAVAHDGAVQVLDDDVADDGSVFLVMELLDGAPVETLAKRAGGKLSVSEVAAIGDQLLDVLVAAHDKEIWHRDLKPENLFVTRQGRVKVLDFGIAKVKQSAANSRATNTGSVMGTPAFMPPEQALGKWNLVDGRTDLFAVGATMLNLLTGVLLHQGETAAEVLVSAATKPAAPTQTFDPSLLPAFAAVLDKALAFNRDERWPDARSMQQALRAACAPGSLQRLVALMDAPRSSQLQSVVTSSVPKVPSTPSEEEEPTRLRQVHGPAMSANYTPTSVLPDPVPHAPGLQHDPMADVMTASPVSMSSYQTARPRRWVPVLIAMLVLLGCTGAAAAWWFGIRKPAAETEEPTAATSVEESEPAPEEPASKPAVEAKVEAPAATASASAPTKPAPVSVRPTPQSGALKPTAPPPKASGKVFQDW